MRMMTLLLAVAALHLAGFVLRSWAVAQNQDGYQNQGRRPRNGAAGEGALQRAHDRDALHVEGADRIVDLLLHA